MANTRNNSQLILKKPVSVWNAPLKASFADLFLALGKGLTNAADGNWPEALTNALDVIKAVGVERDPSELAWLLVRRGLTRAVFDLVGDSHDLMLSRIPDDAQALATSIDATLSKFEIGIDKSLFANPRSFSFLPVFDAALSGWLEAYGLSPAQAASLSKRLPGYFVASLTDEWRSARQTYAKVGEYFDTPFAEANEQELGWQKYYAWLGRQVNERLFEEAFSSSQIYLPLRAFYNIEAIADSGILPHDQILDSRQTKRRVVDLSAELQHWLRKPERDRQIRVISGGPGSGKSLFCKMFAAMMTKDSSLRVLLLPIYQLDLSLPIDDAIGAYLDRTGALPHNPLKSPYQPSRMLLIFDGLDELAMQGRAATEVAQAFVRDVEKYIVALNHEQVRFQVLISGRELVVQSCGTELKRQGQIVHVLPYAILDQPARDVQYAGPQSERYVWDDPQRLLPRDQRDDWWLLYGKLIGTDYKGLPDRLSRPDLDEITCQPLLNYLVARTFVRSPHLFDKDVSLNSIYDDLLSAIHERAYEGHAFEGIRNLAQEDFERVLEEIGVSAWHGNGRTTTIKEIEQRCRQSELAGVLDTFKDGAKAGVTNLLAAFYFRRHGRRDDGEQTFEFTHKSFGEYLTARRVVREVAEMCDQFSDRSPKFGRRWQPQQTLEAWILLCGPTAIEPNLRKFITGEFGLRDRSLLRRMQDMLIDMINFALRDGLPVDKIRTGAPFGQQAQQARNAEEALLVVLNSVAELTQTISKIEWPTSTSAGTWLYRLQGQRSGPDGSITLDCLSYLDLSKCDLAMHDLYAANLKGSDLSSASLQYTNMMLADLQGVCMDRALLEGTNMMRADCSGALLTNVFALQSNLERANLTGANLSYSTLMNANLDRANVTGTIFKEATVNASKVDKEQENSNASLHDAVMRSKEVASSGLGRHSGKRGVSSP